MDCHFLPDPRPSPSPFDAGPRNAGGVFPRRNTGSERRPPPQGPAPNSSRTPEPTKRRPTAELREPWGRRARAARRAPWGRRGMPRHPARRTRSQRRASPGRRRHPPSSSPRGRRTARTSSLWACSSCRTPGTRSKRLPPALKHIVRSLPFLPARRRLHRKNRQGGGGPSLKTPTPRPDLPAPDPSPWWKPQAPSPCPPCSMRSVQSASGKSFSQKSPQLSVSASNVPASPESVTAAPSTTSSVSGSYTVAATNFFGRPR